MAQEPIRVLALRHIMCEYLGAFEGLFEDAGAYITYVDVPAAAGGELPRSHDGYDLLTILGGPMSVNDPDSWLVAEKRFVREAIERDKPVLGLCLGAQMIASSLGAIVAPGKRKEVGFLEIEVSDAAASDPLLRHFARPRQMVFQLHGEGFELPPGAVRLASSALYPNQAFRIGRRCWGFQFHVEIDRPMLLEWIREYWGDPAALAPDSYARIILKEADTRLPQLERLARSVATDILKIARGENPG